MVSFRAVILAAGKSTRMKSKLNKVLMPLFGRPVVDYVVASAIGAGAKSTVVVRNPTQKDLKEHLKNKNIHCAVQKEPLGTAHALLSAKNFFANDNGYVLILCGDTPLLESETISSFVQSVLNSQKKLGVLTMSLSNPASYGRIVKDLDGNVVRIVEANDATKEELKINEVNTGVYFSESKWLFKALKKIGCDNAKQEFYLTDLISLALKECGGVHCFLASDAREFLGINTNVDFAEVANVMRERINRKLMLSGVKILNPGQTYIDHDVSIGAGTLIMPFCAITGGGKLGEDCVVEMGAQINDSSLGDGVHVKPYSVIDGSVILNGAVIGPFARIRPNSKIGRSVRIGNFVEIKKSELKDGVKANHLSYLGDAFIGANANIGCGTITCNYDGVAKYRTVIGNNAFVGSDTQFVAPVKIGSGATIGAGSTITKDVPADALALSRTEQKNVKGWGLKRRKK